MNHPLGARAVLTRSELYEKIWAKPVRTVAAEYGISDVGLRKICVKHDIPRPSPRYWGLVQHGKTPPKVPLPPRAEGVPDQIEIRASLPSIGKVSEGVEIPAVVVPASLEKPHAVVRALRKIMGDRTLPDGMLVVPGDYGSIMRTTPARREPALILYDCLFKALEARGHQIVLEDQPSARRGNTVAAVVGGIKVELVLIERLRQTDHIPTVKELADKARYGYSHMPKYDPTPSGLFTLTAGRRFDVKKTWAEKEAQPLDRVLGEVVVWIEWAAPVLREKERENDERNRGWELEARRSEHQRYLVEKLDRTMSAWSAATRIRSFLEALEREVAPVLQQTPELEAFVAWAGARADTLDPLQRPEELTKDVDVELLGYRRQG